MRLWRMLTNAMSYSLFLKSYKVGDSLNSVSASNVQRPNVALVKGEEVSTPNSSVTVNNTGSFLALHRWPGTLLGFVTVSLLKAQVNRVIM